MSSIPSSHLLLSLQINHHYSIHSQRESAAAHETTTRPLPSSQTLSLSPPCRNSKRGARERCRSFPPIPSPSSWTFRACRRREGDTLICQGGGETIDHSERSDGDDEGREQRSYNKKLRRLLQSRERRKREGEEDKEREERECEEEEQEERPQGDCERPKERKGYRLDRQ